MKRLITTTLFCLCLVSSWAWGAVTCSFNAGTGVSTLVVTGTTETPTSIIETSIINGWNAFLLEDFVDNDGDGIVDGSGATLYNQMIAPHVLLQISDSSTSTSLVFKGWNIYLYDVDIEKYATFTLGELHTGKGRAGSRLSIAPPTDGDLFVDDTSSNTITVGIYDSRVISRNRNTKFFYGDIDVRNSTFTNEQSLPARANRGVIIDSSTFNIDDVYFVDAKGPSIDTQNLTAKKMKVHDTYYGIVSNWPTTIEDFDLTDADSGIVEILLGANAELTLINPIQGDYGPLQLGGVNAWIKFVYEIDPKITDKDGDPISGATVTGNRYHMVTNGTSVFQCDLTHTFGDSGTTPPGVSDSFEASSASPYWIDLDYSKAGVTDVLTSGATVLSGVSCDGGVSDFSGMSGDSGYVTEKQVTKRKISGADEDEQYWRHKVETQKSGKKNQETWVFLKGPYDVDNPLIIQMEPFSRPLRPR